MAAWEMAPEAVYLTAVSEILMPWFISHSPHFLCGCLFILFYFPMLPHVSLYVVVTYEKNQFGTLGCFSCLAVLDKAVLPEDSLPSLCVSLGSFMR